MTTEATATRERVVTLHEHRPVEVELSSEDAAAIQAGGRVTVVPLGGERYQLTARSWVGVARYGEIDLRIQPKVPIGRLLYLAAHGGLDEAWHDLDARLAGVDDPRSALAHVLVWHAERALRPTPLQGYRTEELAEKHLRGRVLFDRQLSRRAGVVIPVELRYDEFDLDIPENQIVLAALRAVEPVVDDLGLLRSIGHLRRSLDEVRPWPRGVPVQQIVWTRLNARYRPAVELAQLLLERGSVEFGAADVAGRGFLINMPNVFEAFLTKALGDALEAKGGRVIGQYATTLDEAGDISMYPDITWWDGGRCLAVIDAKYKRVQNDSYPNADAYQMLAYCIRLGLSEGWLVYADLDGSRPMSQVIHQAGVTLRVESIDLAGTIDDLEASVLRLASAVRNAAGSEQ